MYHSGYICMATCHNERMYLLCNLKCQYKHAKVQTATTQQHIYSSNFLEQGSLMLVINRLCRSRLMESHPASLQ